jgi:hypothetical protein
MPMHKGIERSGSDLLQLLSEIFWNKYLTGGRDITTAIEA